MSTRVFVALGSNLGDRAATIEAAIGALDTVASTRVVGRGPVIEAPALLPPADATPQPAYLNTVVEVTTGLEPEPLLAALKQVERDLGRVEARRWAPRIIDLDLLLYGERVVQTPALTVPHPGLASRRFVLEPLAALAPALVHPVLRRSISALLAACAAPNQQSSR